MDSSLGRRTRPLGQRWRAERADKDVAALRVAVIAPQALYCVGGAQMIQCPSTADSLEHAHSQYSHMDAIRRVMDHTELVDQCVRFRHVVRSGCRPLSILKKRIVTVALRQLGADRDRMACRGYKWARDVLPRKRRKHPQAPVAATSSSRYCL